MRARMGGAVGMFVLLLSLTACGEADGTKLAGEASPTPSSAGPCDDSQFDAAGIRSRDVIAASVRNLLNDSQSKGDPRKVVYFTDHGEPGSAGGEPEPSSQPGTASQSKDRFPDPLLRCLASGELPGLPEMTIVTGHDDPSIEREKPDGFSRMTKGRVLAVSAVPPSGDAVRMTVSSGGGGGLDYFGGTYLVEHRADGTWQVAKTLSQFIA